MSDHLDTLRLYETCPAKALSISTRTWLSKHLNPEMDSLSSNLSLLQDWRGVAEFLEFQSLDIDNFARDKNPTMELLRQWAFRDTSTIGCLLKAIEAVERFEILKEEQLPGLLERDYRSYQKFTCQQPDGANSAMDTGPIQDPEVTSVDEFRNITVNEVTTGVPEYFDAFVCYTYQDFEFVRHMMHKLETVQGLKLCIVSRDLMPGCAEYVIMAKLIQERCKKMIIVLSPDYLDSRECEFQTRFAFSLAPGAKEKKLIPVIYRPCQIPAILNHICTVDYTRCDVVDWFWIRLANSLKGSHRPGFEQLSSTQVSYINPSYEEPMTSRTSSSHFLADSNSISSISVGDSFEHLSLPSNLLSFHRSLPMGDSVEVYPSEIRMPSLSPEPVKPQTLSSSTGTKQPNFLKKFFRKGS